ACCSAIEAPPAPANVEAICLACRTVFPTPRPCDAGPGHRVVKLTTGAGRARLLRETWGYFPRREQLRKVIRSRIIGNAAVPPEPGPADALLGFFTMIHGVVAEIGDVVTDARLRRLVRCYGARLHGLSPKGIRPTYGVAEGEPAPSPLRGDACL